MSPIVTTMAAPAGRARRVKAPAPAAPGSSYGAGPNAPAWSGKTVYNEERFTSPLTGVANANGNRIINGVGITPAMYDFPTVSTPFGEKLVMRTLFNGSTANLTAVDQTTSTYEYLRPSEPYGAAIRVEGTWTGTIAFEVSADETTWSPITLVKSGIGSHVTGSDTAMNGTWRTPLEGSGYQFIRARAAILSSGTAVVSIGQRGGFTPHDANFSMQGNETHTRMYWRMVYRFSEGFNNNGNSGTKLMFWATHNGNNHYFDGTSFQVATQPALAGPVPDPGGTVSTNEWYDVEYQIITGDPGTANGSVRLWVNGTLVGSADNKQLLVAGSYSPRINLSYFNPTFGGGGNPPPALQWIDTAYVYRESAP